MTLKEDNKLYIDVHIVNESYSTLDLLHQHMKFNYGDNKHPKVSDLPPPHKVLDLRKWDVQNSYFQQRNLQMIE